VLEIEHSLGVAFAARSPAETVPDWPPQPDRVFSALVAAWGGRNCRHEERQALEWLESQQPPEIAASGGFARTSATVFVPPNDPESGRVAERSVMPDLRRRQPRRFPAFRPDNPVVHFLWRDAEADAKTLAALNAVAIDVTYVGHSASLTRCRFRTGKLPKESMPARRRVYAGRLCELEQAFGIGHRPKPGEDVRAHPGTEQAHIKSVFSDRWLVLEHVGGGMPDIRAAALVSKTLRYALMSGYKANGQEAAIPSIVSGHEPDGAPIADPHLAITPLAFLGTPYADGRVLGFALIPRGAGELLDDADFQAALRAVAKWKLDPGRRELELVCDGFKVTLAPTGDDTRRSLDPAPYVAVATTWASCTPIVLDRHLKARTDSARDQEVRELIARACLNIGLPTPSSAHLRGDPTENAELAIAAGKHSAIKGAPSAYPSGHAPRWTGWRLPKALASRQLTHAVLQFETPVRGPVILGAGRFAGLGLCRALDASE
jgi:CRISPR-associated protein Csb2